MAEAKQNPYSTLPKSAFWKTAVAQREPLDIKDLWDPKFPIRPQHKVVTFGSCFAQHIGRALNARGYKWFITEEAPPQLSEEARKTYNYDLFTCRTGNIYTTSLLRQWVQWALEETVPPSEYWEADGRYFDPFRPVVEPAGFESPDELFASRNCTIAAFRRAIVEAKYFVFTMGLTESWFNKSKGYEYPMCPGTAAGTFDPAEHVFRNQDFSFVRDQFNQALRRIRSVNKNLRFILTVSPVPLTATNSKRNVLVATTESKSVLRAVAGQLAANQPIVDYFPSYEVITSPVFGGRFFESNLRSVRKEGVDFVMDNFFTAQKARFGGGAAVPVASRSVKREMPPDAQDDVVCEERLLEAFGSR